MSAVFPDLMTLNRSCDCLPLNTQQVRIDVGQQLPQLDMPALLAAREDLFAHSGVFVSAADVAQMSAVVDAIEAAVALPAYRGAVGRREPSLATRLQLSTRGLFMGYDFHLTPQGPQLIEVNTNAGGAGLVAAMQRASGIRDPQCTGARLETLVPDVSNAITEMVRDEWRLSGREGEPKRIAIVDTAPEQEYLYPDMLLIQGLLAEHGLVSQLVPASQLVWNGEKLCAGGQPIDMVYNRLTDFGLQLESNSALRHAWLADAVVVSPAPEHHALFADKRNLVLLSDANNLALDDLAEQHKSALSRVPKTQLVDAINAEEMWQERKQLFFKPVAGFAGRGAYRGGKLTKRVWQTLQQQPYVAQTLVPPAQRRVPALAGDDQGQLLKFDIRLYTYAGQPLLLAARAYQGQTTNFRTPGGGFAPVFGCL